MLQTFMLICHLWNSLISLWDSTVPQLTHSLAGPTNRAVYKAFVTQIK